MKYRDEDYIHLRLVSNPESDHGFELVDAATGRPVANVANVQVERGFKQEPPFYMVPQKVTVALLGIPVDLSFPDWETFAKARQAAHERDRAAAAAAAKATAPAEIRPAPPAASDAVPLPPAAG